MTTENEYYCYHSPLSELYLTVCDGFITRLEYEPERAANFARPLHKGDAKKWLDAYFAGQLLPLSPAMSAQGTDFQKKVWQVMLGIPYGETLSYGEVSDILASAPRAVGQACKRNPIPILIPCHRIIAKKSIGGYEGATGGHKLNRKKWLIKHEQSKIGA